MPSATAIWRDGGNWTVICTIHRVITGMQIRVAQSHFHPQILATYTHGMMPVDILPLPATLADKSGNGYNLANSSTGGGSPTVTSNAQNGLNVLTFDSTGTSVNVYYEGNIVGQNTNQTWSILFKPVTGHDHGTAGVISYGTNQNGDWNLRAGHSSQFPENLAKTMPHIQLGEVQTWWIIGFWQPSPSMYPDNLYLPG